MIVSVAPLRPLALFLPRFQQADDRVLHPLGRIGAGEILVFNYRFCLALLANGRQAIFFDFILRKYPKLIGYSVLHLRQ